MQGNFTESYLNSIFQLTVPDRKRVLTTISELMNNPKSPSLSIHQIERIQCDSSFRSARVNDNFRIIFSSQGDRFVLLYVDKHDDGTGTMKRSKKDSFAWYKKVIASNGEDLA